MKVFSPLANLDLHIGTIKRSGNNISVIASEESSLPTEVIATPSDVLRVIGSMLTSPSLWLYLLLLPFHWWLAKSAQDVDGPGQATDATNINKPW